MKAFAFRLEKVLEWRQKELGLAEAEFRRRTEAVAAVDRMTTDLATLARRETSAVHAAHPILGGALASLERYHQHVVMREKQLEAKRADCAAQAAEAEKSMLEARRRARLLEKLKGRRLREWQAAASRELEEVASESYLAQWTRRR